MKYFVVALLALAIGVQANAGFLDVLVKEELPMDPGDSIIDQVSLVGMSKTGQVKIVCRRPIEGEVLATFDEVRVFENGDVGLYFNNCTCEVSVGGAKAYCGKPKNRFPLRLSGTAAKGFVERSGPSLVGQFASSGRSPVGPAFALQFVVKEGDLPNHEIGQLVSGERTRVEFNVSELGYFGLTAGN